MLRTHYPDGAPCWPELTTPDPETAARFYTEIFGWTYHGLGPKVWNYTVCLLDGAPVAGLLPPAVGLEKAPARWNVYLATSQVDASAVRVQANNGELVVLPSDVPELGRLALAVDREGACFGLYEKGRDTGPIQYKDYGALCWNELHARSATVADVFYTALFGYEPEQIGDGIDFDYVLWSVARTPVAGRLRMSEDSARLPPHWKNYLTVHDCGEAEARIRRAGGRVLIGAYDMPHGRVAVVADPAGAIFCLCEHGACHVI
ncbi:VOC family protein [Sphaerisporangium aureirubrum]|uniref:VOC family protein n=1 Tax=Sphaerisporangium aureirubrum TaxID=1544736 RepID=A0ABW1NP57_9ACTN